jgi:hypothetical protein
MYAADMTQSTLRSDESVETVLHRIHDAWLADAHRFLGPSLEPTTDQWARWGAVRYLADDFREQYGWERLLLDELRPFVLPPTAAQLMRQADQLSRLHLELDRIGRRRGTAEEFAGGARYLLEQLALWCAELELAGRDIPIETLAPGALRILDHLDAVAVSRG